jgi:fimbrial chaperone protein
VRSVSAFAALVGLALATAGGARAASYAVAPSTFTLVAPARNATITLTNLSLEPIRFQVSGLAWSENTAGTALLTPTPDLVVFPQLFTIPPLGTQVVRGAVIAPPRATERTFRIAIETMPPLGEIVHATAGMQINMRTRFMVPIYVQPAVHVFSSRIEYVAVHGDRLTFAVLNTGNTHLAGASLFVNGTDAGGKTVLSRTIDDWHVLAGARREYTLEIAAATCFQKLTIGADAGDGLPSAQTVDVAACR